MASAANTSATTATSHESGDGTDGGNRAGIGRYDHHALTQALIRLSVSGLFDPRDDREGAMRFIQKGRIHYVSFAKHLPHTTQAIQEGRIDPVVFARSLVDFIYEEQTNEQIPDLVVLPSFWELKTSPYFLGYHISNYAIPPGWFHQQGAATISSTDHEDLRKKLCLALGKAILENGNKIQGDEPLVILEKACRRSCVECADMIDRGAFHGNRGCFLRLCPLLVRSSSFYGSQFYSQVLDAGTQQVDALDCLYRKLNPAVKGVKFGSHKAEIVCWECDKPTKAIAACCCGGCGLAAYCSDKCQSKAWKGGHKSACAELKSEYRSCEETYAILEMFYDEKQQLTVSGEPPLHRGIELNHLSDCRLAFSAHVLSCTHDYLRMGSPSVDKFYDNLGKIAQGEWWIWPHSETCSLATYRSCLIDKDDSSYFHALASSLFFFDSSTDSEIYNEMIDSILVDEEVSVPMPAERFLERYANYDTYRYFDKNDRSLRYRNQKCMLLSFYQKFFQKFFQK